MAAEPNPLLAKLPPVADYFDYLTEIEPHINKENLLVLHDVLQDTKLTTNIGWDLVHPLLPLLPESEECLQDIARRGNPREVILKVTEALRILGFRDEDEDSDEEGNAEEVKDAENADKLKSDAGPESASTQTGASNVEPQALPLPILQFRTLLSMLSILHPRVKAKYPSRFLSTSLQAVLSSYSSATSHFGDLTGSIIAFVKTLSGTKRPHLPPRQSSSHVPTASSVGVATDPEAQNDPPPEEEKVLMNRLLQAFVTHVMEEYLLHLTSDEDVPGLSWSSRVQERLNPKMTVPVRVNYTRRFAEDEDLRNRSLVVSQLMALGQDLKLDSKELYKTILDRNEDSSGLPSNEDEPPASAEDIPFSRTGALFFFTARHVAKRLLDINTDAPSITIFPAHDSLLTNFLSADTLAAIGTEPEALIDALLALGLIALDDSALGEPQDDEHFTRYLQLTSLLSANCPSPSLRFHAHCLTSSLLRSYPSEFVRLSFIRDTLEHCPYENLKASAVGWLKGETLEANAATLGAPGSSTQSGLGISQPDSTADDDDTVSIFATPVALSTVAPFIFPDLTHDLTTTSLSESFARLKLDLAFYLAALNFYYLLLAAKPLHAVLDIPGLHQRNDIGGSWLGPLREAVGRFREGLQVGGELRGGEGEEGAERGLFDLRLLEDVLGRVDAGVRALN